MTTPPPSNTISQRHRDGVFNRENRYIVIKRSQLHVGDAHISEEREQGLRDYLEENDIYPVEGVVVEADWPEYEVVWRMIEARVSVNWDDKSSAVEIGHAIGMSAEDFTTFGNEIVKVLARHRQASESRLIARLKSDDVREAVARSYCVANGIGENTLHQYHEWEDFPIDQSYEYQDKVTGKTRTMLLHYAWRIGQRLAHADAALFAITTMIEGE